MDFIWRIKLTDPKTGQRIKDLIRKRTSDKKRLFQKDVCNACSLAEASLSRFLRCKEEIPGDAFVRLYQKLNDYYKSMNQQSKVNFMRDYIPPKNLNKELYSGTDLNFSYYVF